MRLLKEKTLTFTRFAEGFISDDGDWLDGAETTIIVQGSLQPFQGSSRAVLPEGVSSKDARVFYTKDEILTTNQLTNTQAYEVEIEGFTFVVTDSGPWIDSGLSLNHYAVILIRKDKNESDDQ